MGIKLHTLKDLRSYFAKELEAIYTQMEISALVNIIIKTKTGVSGLHQIYDKEIKINDEQISGIIALCEELKTGRPYQHLLGETTFYDQKIMVNDSVLIPRPETEELVDLIIRENRGFNGKIIDLGTGSGCIAISLAANLPGASVTGIDISGEAIKIARENASINQVKVTFKMGDIFRLRNNTGLKAGIIVSNPPYVRESEKKFMHRNVLDFEPHHALFVNDSDPLVYYKAIFDLSASSLAKGGKLYFEINEAMGNQIAGMFAMNGYSGTVIIKDINNRDRIAKGIKND